ncbi:MAG: GTPase Era [Bdellovibrionales bacterium]|nr:GTPase Era [Bdellovibrionales bacterium]
MNFVNTELEVVKPESLSSPPLDLKTYRAGYVGLIGQPNAGKSTLLNAILGEKLAIVSPKPQTTRQRVVGIYNGKSAQICFADAPGLIRAEKGLNRFLAHEFSDVISESDVLLAVLALDEKKPELLREVADLVHSTKKPWAIVITKTDLPLKHRHSILRDLLAGYDVPKFWVSALTKQSELKEMILPCLVEKLPLSPGPLFPLELYTPHSLRDLATEYIREQCFVHLHQEIPFNLAVRLRSFDENSGKKVQLEADLVVGKPNHRPIVIGQGGQKLKTIGQTARLEIEKLLGRSVILKLHVAVRPQWMDNPNTMKEFGYALSPS